MFIEQKIDQILAELVELRAAVKGQTKTAPAAAVKAAEPAKQANPVPKAEVPVEAVAEAVARLGGELVKKDRPALLGILKQLGVERVSHIPAEKHAQAAQLLGAALTTPAKAA